MIEKYIKKLKEEIENLEVVGDDKGVLDMAKRYLSDSEYFLKNKDEKRAIEAMAISWAYIDALARLGIVKIKDKTFFTIG